MFVTPPGGSTGVTINSKIYSARDHEVIYVPDADGAILIAGSGWIQVIGSGGGLAPIPAGTILGNTSGVTAIPGPITALPSDITTSSGGQIFGSNDTQTLTNKDIDGGSNTLSNLPASQLVGLLGVSGATGTWDVANGGTGASSLSGILKGNAASSVTAAVSSDVIATFTGTAVDANHYLATDGSRQALPSVGSPSDIQIISSSGTWTKPAGTPQYTRLILMAGGGGGGGGASVASGTTASGGGGGGSSFLVDMTFVTGSLGATETVTIGAGGTAGTAGSTSAGGPGGVGGSSAFGSWATAFGGGGGQGGGVAAAAIGGGGAGAISVGIAGASGGAAGSVGGSAGGTNSGTLPIANIASAGGAGDTAGSNGSAGAASGYGPTGGGAGAGLAASPVALSGGGSGKNIGNPTGAGAGNPGLVSTANYFGGTGGGGGNSAASTNTAQTGGTGARGGGGGGGGAALTTGTAGAGGAGGGGYCVVITMF